MTDKNEAPHAIRLSDLMKAPESGTPEYEELAAMQYRLDEAKWWQEYIAEGIDLLSWGERLLLEESPTLSHEERVARIENLQGISQRVDNA